jgi:molybdate transport system substrate-binding protein
MANPNLAPYGLAAREVLEALGLWRELQDRAVRGENIGQAFQFVASGNAELGFIALSQITKPGNRMRAGSYWQIPQELYTPIEQQAVLLTDKVAAREFKEFIRSEEARAIIQQTGYQAPQEEAN